MVENLADAVLNGYLDVDELDTNRRVFQVAGEGNYGLADSRFEECLDQLRAHRVPFIASCDTKYEWIGEMIVFDGTNEFGGTWTNGPLLSQTEYALIEQGTHPWAHTVGEYFDRLTVDVGHIEISHLPSVESITTFLASDEVARPPVR